MAEYDINSGGSVTRILNAVRMGEAGSADDLLAAVYSELRHIAEAKMSRERAGQTLQPTALVHEAWLRLGDGARFENRSHFFSAAAEAMRRILIERARRRAAAKHGGNVERCDLDGIEIAAPISNDDRLLAVNEALDRFAKDYPDKAELVKLRFFTGMSLTEAGAVLGLSDRTAKRHWAYAKAWLFDAINAEF